MGADRRGGSGRPHRTHCEPAAAATTPSTGAPSRSDSDSECPSDPTRTQGPSAASETGCCAGTVARHAVGDDRWFAEVDRVLFAALGTVTDDAPRRARPALLRRHQRTTVEAHFLSHTPPRRTAARPAGVVHTCDPAWERCRIGAGWTRFTWLNGVPRGAAQELDLLLVVQQAERTGAILDP